MALFGVAGAVTLLVYCLQEYQRLGNAGAPRDLAASIWAVVVAPLVPGCAAVLVPRRFAVAVLLGWITGGTALVLPACAFLGWASLTVGRTTILLYGLTLLALLVVAVLLAREAPASEAEAAGG